MPSTEGSETRQANEASTHELRPQTCCSKTLNQAHLSSPSPSSSMRSSVTFAAPPAWVPAACCCTAATSPSSARVGRHVWGMCSVTLRKSNQGAHACTLDIHAAEHMHCQYVWHAATERMHTPTQPSCNANHATQQTDRNTPAACGTALPAACEPALLAAAAGVAKSSCPSSSPAACMHGIKGHFRQAWSVTEENADMWGVTTHITPHDATRCGRRV